MKIAVRVGKAAAVVVLAMPMAAMAQLTGTSHPDDKPILNSPEVAPALPVQPVYQPMPVQQAALKPTPYAPAEAAPVPVRMAEPMLDEGGKFAATPDVDAGIVTRVPGPSNQLPVGTLVKVRLADDISTATTPAGTMFTAELIEAVERDGRVLLPAGSTLSGQVTEIHGGKRISGTASIHLRTFSVTLPDGTRYKLHGQVIDTNLYKETRVDREGTILRRDHAGKTAATMALTTGSGAAAGAVLGGVPGAVIGAGVGAGVSTVVWLKQDRQTELPVDTRITFSLIEPLTVGGA
jgi:hypothetical protein